MKWARKYYIPGSLKTGKHNSCLHRELYGISGNGFPVFNAPQSRREKRNARPRGRGGEGIQLHPHFADRGSHSILAIFLYACIFASRVWSSEKWSCGPELDALFLPFVIKSTYCGDRGPDIFLVLFPSKILVCLSPPKPSCWSTGTGWGERVHTLVVWHTWDRTEYFATKEPETITKTCGYLRSHMLLRLQALFPGNGPQRKVCVGVCVCHPRHHIYECSQNCWSIAALHTSREILFSLLQARQNISLFY